MFSKPLKAPAVRVPVARRESRSKQCKEDSDEETEAKELKIIQLDQQLSAVVHGGEAMAVKT